MIKRFFLSFIIIGTVTNILGQNIRPNQTLNPRSVQYKIDLSRGATIKIDSKKRAQEEDDRQLVEKGKEDIILRENLESEYQIRGLPNFDNIYYESAIERGFIIYFITFPIVTIYSFLAIQGLQLLSGSFGSNLTNTEVAVALLAGAITAGSITAYDYQQIKKRKLSKNSHPDPFPLGRSIKQKNSMLYFGSTFDF